MALENPPIYDHKPELIWENNPDTPITASALSKSADLVISYLDFKYNDNNQPFHYEGTILMADPIPNPIRIVLKRGTCFSIINQVDTMTHPDGQYKIFDTGLDDLWITLDNRDEFSSSVSSWGINRQWFIFICDELINNPETGKNSARFIVSESSFSPRGTRVPGTEYNFSEKDTRLIGGFKSNSSSNIIPSSVWDIAGKFHTVKAKQYKILDEYAISDAGRHVYRPLRINDLETNGLDSNIGGNLNVSQNINVLGNINVSGNITTSMLVGSASKFLSTRVDWVGTGIIDSVIGQMAWKNYGNNHTIFDASAGTSPSGTIVSNLNATNPWTTSYPILMGWDGVSTFGVRVDSARQADIITSQANSATITATTVGTANQIALRDSSADIEARLFKSTFNNETTIAGAIAFRADNSANSSIRFCSNREAIKVFLGITVSPTAPTNPVNGDVWYQV